MAMIDLEPAANAVTGLLGAVTDEQLDNPTPCDIPVGALLDHLMNLAQAFTWGAQKSGPATGAPPGPPSTDHLDPDWRQKLPKQLDGLVRAWRAPAAWEGMAHVGGVTMPAGQMGVVALDELVLHGWDLARATGQQFNVDGASTAAVLGFTTEMAKPEHAAARNGLFGPVIDVPNGASDFDRALGLAGRDSAWKSP